MILIPALYKHKIDISVYTLARVRLICCNVLRPSTVRVVTVYTFVDILIRDDPAIDFIGVVSDRYERAKMTNDDGRWLLHREV